MKSYVDCLYIIETDEKNPKRVAVAHSLPVTVESGYKVRPELLPNNDPFGITSRGEHLLRDE